MHRPASPTLAARRSAFAIGLCAWWTVGPAWAEPSVDDKARASALFKTARALMSQGSAAEACPQLEESHRLDPSGGTVLNLALCYEQTGRLVRSTEEFREAIEFARHDSRQDRVQAAEDHLRAIEPRLSRLTVHVSESARLDGLRVECDELEIEPAAWSTAIPVDIGEHVVRAVAPGREPFTTKIVIERESDVRTVEVPVLVGDAPAPAQPSVASSPPALPPVPLSPPASDDGSNRSPVRRTLAWTAGAAGLAQLGIAGYFGLQAFSRHAESNAECPGERCSPLGVELNGESRRAADVSTVLTITGLVTVATSVYLLLTSSQASPVASSASVTGRLVMTGQGSTVGVEGRF